MSRSARLTVENKDCWYFLHAKVNASLKKNSLTDKGSGDKLLSIIEAYSRTFCCDMAGVFISKHHYALVVKFHKFKKISSAELLKKAKYLYEGKQERYDLWTKTDYSDFNKRLFDVGEFMRSIQMTFSRWQNSQSKRKGKLWAERFKSSILTTDEAALDAVMYLEAGSIREKDSSSLTYKFSSNTLRASGKADWLYPIDGNFGLPKGAKGKEIYQQKLNHRAKLPVKSKDISKKEIENGYAVGCYLKRQRYLWDGLIIGSAKDVQAWIHTLKVAGKYIRKTRPTKIAVGTQYSLREQRSHFVEYK